MLALEQLFASELIWDVKLHIARAYQTSAIGVPVLFALLWQSSRSRWASFWVGLLFSTIVMGAILFLPSFPAQPRLGPVMYPVTHFVPPKFHCSCSFRRCFSTFCG
jgi:hypothetical protein